MAYKNKWFRGRTEINAALYYNHYYYNVKQIF